MRLGVDTGGTFTDVVADDGSVVKVLSTPAQPGRAVIDGVEGVASGRPELLAHGTTVATNALLERRGATVALITTEGLADVIEIGRQDRPSLYDPFADRPEPLVPRDLRLEVAGRLAADGAEVAPMDEAKVPDVPEEAEAVAVCLLHADLDSAHERRVAAVLGDRGHDVVCSHEVSPEFREYERSVTTVVDAYLRPVTRSYLHGLADVADRVLVMTSAGGLVAVAEAAEHPASLLLSGPAGGVRAAAEAAVAAGFPDAVSFDMGGTSTDVCLVIDGAPEPAAQRRVAGFPVRLPALDIHTIGAGGGSVARIDPGGALVVGPQSAGADPGPACYGRGGSEPTVTDADLVAGRIPGDAELPGIGALDFQAAAAAIEKAGLTAEGVITVVDVAMEKAIRVVTVERGVDPRYLALVAFGGAGPLHACALADALGMAAVVVPPRAGVLSAVGLLGAPPQAVLVRSWPGLEDHRGLPEARLDLARAAARSVVGREPAAHARLLLNKATATANVTFEDATAVEVELSLDCRYQGQSHELTVPGLTAFEEEHRRRNGFARPGVPVEVVALRAAARLPAPVDPGGLPAPPGRRGAIGPRPLAEADCTVWLPDGWSAEVGKGGAWILRRSRS
ncbi:MAG: hydantoinase/oxoprolinase family protein [Actinomycetota bacterium]|nr:hydantoinase/oxoprolinase family protein [Actinomycetota bacterium]